MEIIEAFILTYSLIMVATSWIPAGLIRSYLRNKPTGLQTLLDKVDIDLTYASQFCLTNFHLATSLAMITDSINVYLAIMIHLFVHTQALAIFSFLLSVSIVRYLSIYHGHWLESTDEHKIVVSIRGFNVFIIVLGLILDVNLAKKNGLIYQLLAGQEDIGRLGFGMFTLPIMIVMIILTVAITHFRSSFDQFKIANQSSKSFLKFIKTKFSRMSQANYAEAQDQNSATAYGSDRLLIKISVVIGVFIMVSSFVTSFVIPNSVYPRTITVSFSIFLMGIGNPLLIISRNENMKKFSRQIIKNIIASNVLRK